MIGVSLLVNRLNVLSTGSSECVDTASNERANGEPNDCHDSTIELAGK
jgi:hypothetical protein